ncbi:helicase-related protein [Nocardia rosealba]|uniref:helicase-related protein n=1 Tax=Nocardia rosealba TaxID=2878563 RepID=UPI001CDA4581|nr:helicase-related protein [Nocardia rosealba]MCA2206678.1 helicase [Nocardia rosealba]
MDEDLSPWYEARDSLVDSLEEELMGPRKLEPLLEPPLNRIIVGVLYPRVESQADDYKAGLAEDAAGEAGSTADDAATEVAVSLSHAHKPSSVGLTFTVDPAITPRIAIHASARKYAESGQVWTPHEVATGEDVLIDCTAVGPIDRPVAEGELLRIVGVVRAPTAAGHVRISVSLVNSHSRTDASGSSDGSSWFRPSIIVSTPEGGFVDRSIDPTQLSADPDERSARFLYRNEPILAIGHGCAVDWDEHSTSPGTIWTTFIPSQQVHLARPAGGDDHDDFGRYDLRMDQLAETSDRAQLHAMVDAYERWISTRGVEAETIDSPAHRSVALEHMKRAAECARRIRAGISALDHPQVDRAFRLMNRAMVHQRRAQDRSRGEVPKPQRWRPFQMAYILMNLPALADPRHPDRAVADLLWFPTGGGKTEAYLGCIGFTILLRRLRREDNGGVSAIMRYTLRLLTRQQFERAGGLICALELVRRTEIPEAAPISLGLWVGNAATPSDTKEAQRILRQIAEGEHVQGSTPMQLVRCPWCGVQLTHKHYDASGESMTIACGESGCDFRDGLPLYVLDSDIYANRPSLIISTVDKFALMTWKHEVGLLLSADGPTDSRPDLIVQDELHLISGPLGTIVGLNEAAIDMVCTGEGRPKILASTATVRRAAKQVRAVFDRGTAQFPPPGLTPSDNYFAVDAPAQEKGTRRYVGVMAPGTSQSTLLVRIYSVLLQAVGDLDAPDEVRDTYWTLLGYFNALRVLGSAYLQVLDDVPDRMDVVAARRQRPVREISQEPVELTSRVDQMEIPNSMARLETSYPNPQSPDVALATNMISVGLDIDRLGLMVVAGQPQSTSEYIQSTSRVGRRNPGLVIVALNSQRSRDSSHYASFIPFHRSLYREVESTTATPFAPRARDRAGHGVLVASTRLMIPQLSTDESAQNVVDFSSEIDGLIERLVARAKRISPAEAGPFAEQLRELLARWKNEVGIGAVQRYGSMRPPNAKSRAGDKPLIDPAEDVNAGSFPVRGAPWPTMTSMRDVDAETSLYVKYLKRKD